MVLTRSHDHTPATAGKESARDNGMESVTPGKREREYDANAATPSQPAAKRRKAVETLKNDITSSPQIATAVVIEVVTQDTNGMRKMESSQSEPDARLEGVTEIGAPVSTTSPQPRTSVELINDSLTESVSVALDHAGGREECRKETLLADDDEPGQLPPSLDRGKNLKNLTKVNKPLTEDGTNPEPSDRVIDDPKITTSPSTPPKGTHKRFDSTEPEPFQPQSQEETEDKEPPDNNKPSDTSDDEAPETVTASSGQAQALTAALEQSKAALQLKKERKSRRRERDAKLKEQAKAAAKRATKADVAPKPSKPKRAAVEAIDEDNTPVPTTKPPTPHKPKQPLPALLPDHILTDEPPIRRLLPLPQPLTSKATPNQKKRFPDLVPKRPKDIKKGGVRIRVLREANGMLPPKVSRQGRALREAWLMGQRGGGTVVERRKMRGQGGFVRRGVLGMVWGC